jgi:caa(3)-type oxidase subunit IV
MSSSHAEAGHMGSGSGDTGHEDHSHDPNHQPAHYIKIWAILLGLLAVSVTGPMLGIRTVTLIAAFGIACVKAFLVIKHFMHLTVEKKVAQYAIAGCFGMMLLFFMAVAPDVMRHLGTNWQNRGASNMKHVIEQSEERYEEYERGGKPEAGKEEGKGEAGKPEEGKPAEAGH